MRKQEKSFVHQKVHGKLQHKMDNFQGICYNKLRMGYPKWMHFT